MLNFLDSRKRYELSQRQEQALASSRNDGAPTPTSTATRTNFLANFRMHSVAPPPPPVKPVNEESTSVFNGDFF